MTLSERARKAGWFLDGTRLRRFFAAGWEAAFPNTLQWRQLVAGTGPATLYRQHAGLELHHRDRPTTATRSQRPSSVTRSRIRKPDRPPMPEAFRLPVPVLLGHERFDRRHEVTIHPRVRRSIREAIAVSRELLDSDYEIGGYLYGKRGGRRSRRSVEILRATLATKKSLHQGAILDQDSVSDPYQVVGTWHTHPRRMLTPSAQDRRAALADLKRENLPLHVDLIVIPPAVRGQPEFVAWLTQREADGRAVTRPMRIAD